MTEWYITEMMMGQPGQRQLKLAVFKDREPPTEYTVVQDWYTYGGAMTTLTHEEAITLLHALSAYYRLNRIVSV